MDWIFDGIGTFLIGLVVGGGAGSVVSWRVLSNRFMQVQKAGDNSQQSQVGRDKNSFGGTDER